jgi:hypothetical protein
MRIFRRSDDFFGNFRENSHVDTVLLVSLLMQVLLRVSLLLLTSVMSLLSLLLLQMFYL